MNNPIRIYIDRRDVRYYRDYNEIEKEVVVYSPEIDDDNDLFIVSEDALLLPEKLQKIYLNRQEKIEYINILLKWISENACLTGIKKLLYCFNLFQHDSQNNSIGSIFFENELIEMCFVNDIKFNYQDFI